MLIGPRTTIVRLASRGSKRWVYTALAALAGFLTLALLSSPLFAQSRPATPSEHHVVVISLDGLGASLLAEATPKLRLPNLRRLMREGSSAEGVFGVYPSVTYPSHTTLVTGRLPAEHGIYSNESSREAGKNAGDWFWFAKDIKVPTLWDEARRNHLTTAAVFWPVTAGASIDWNIPEIWDPQKGMVADPLYIAKFATPGILFDALLELGLPPPGTDEDVTRTRLAIFLLKRHKPNLLLVHLATLDAVEHDHGPQSSEAAATLEHLDARVGEILAAITDVGLDSSTDVFIVSDHGFLPVESVIEPNVLLVKAGLLTANEQGEVSGGKIATVSNGGSFFVYWPDGLDYAPQVDEALKPLRGQSLLWALIDRPALRDLGAEPAARLALEAPAGSTFGSRARGALVEKRNSLGGAHGFLPFRPELHSILIAWGSRIRKGVNLHQICMTAIGPTILKAMGIDDPHFGKQPPLLDIFK